MAKKCDTSDSFVLVRKRREYGSSDQYPKIRTDRETYETLAHLAAESGQSIAEIVRQAVAFSVDHLEWAEETPR